MMAYFCVFLEINVRPIFYSQKKIIHKFDTSQIVEIGFGYEFLEKYERTSENLFVQILQCHLSF